MKKSQTLYGRLQARIQLCLANPALLPALLEESQAQQYKTQFTYYLAIVGAFTDYPQLRAGYSHWQQPYWVRSMAERVRQLYDESYGKPVAQFLSCLDMEPATRQRALEQFAPPVLYELPLLMSGVVGALVHELYLYMVSPE